MKINCQQVLLNNYRKSNPFYAAQKNQKFSMNTASDGKYQDKLRRDDIPDEECFVLRRELTNRKREAKSQKVYMASDNIIASTKSYSDSLKAQRESQKDASLEKKKLKYQFKDISSQIVRSKTSVAARRAVGQARRELLRLKQEKRSGKYDPEEIEAAIEHAKSMERIAKKKVRHLEEEEMARAAGGVCSDIEYEREKDTSEEGYDTQETQDSEDMKYMAEYDEADHDGEVFNSSLQEGLENLQSIEESLEDSMADLRSMIDDMAYSVATVSEELGNSMQDMLDELDEGLKDMLEDMGFGESASAAAVKGDMDPQDLKMLKIKHRNKEMKEIVKADAEYLKTIFKHLNKSKAVGAVGSAGSGTTAIATGVGAFVTAPTGQVATPSIDIAL